MQISLNITRIHESSYALGKPPIFKMRRIAPFERPVLHQISRKAMTRRSYSREEAVAAIRGFYEFFTKTPSLNPSDIAYPPPEGWPEINASTMAGLNKNEDVIDLLKHLPYTPWLVQVAYQTHTIDYTSSQLQEDIAKGRLEGYLVPFGAGVIPEHVIPLTTGHRYGSSLLLDTQEGKSPRTGTQIPSSEVQALSQITSRWNAQDEMHRPWIIRVTGARTKRSLLLFSFRAG